MPSDLDVDFQAKLLALVPDGTPVQQNYWSTDKAEPRVWFQRRGGDTTLLLSGRGTELTETSYEVQVDGLNPDVAGTIARTLQDALNGFRGIMGTNTVLGAFVEDANDDFVPRGVESDDGFHAFAFNVRILQ